MNRREAAANARRVRAEKIASRRASISQGRVEVLSDPTPDAELLRLREEIGYALNRQWGASGLRVNLGDIDEEYVPELRSLRSRSRILERMSNDPIVRSQLRTICMTLISGVRWKVVGGKEEHRKLVEANLLRLGPRRFWCSTSWIERLYEILGCLVYGFSIFAKTRAAVDGLKIFSDIKWLHPRSIRDFDGWNLDRQDNLVSVRREYTNALNELVRDEIPASELWIVPWDKRGPNWEGNAYIRPMYRPWKERDLAGKIWLIDLQNRGVGIPMAKLSAIGGAKEKEVLIQILKSIRGGSKERQFIVLDKDSTVEFLTSGGSVPSSSELMDAKRLEAAAAGGTQMLEMGSTDTGSRASASALLTPFLMNVDAIRISIQEIVNHGAGNMPGLVEELVTMNFGEVEECPIIDGSRVSPTEQLDNVPLLLDSIQKGGMAAHHKYNNEIARRLGYPELSEEEFESARQSAPLRPGGGPGRPPEIGPRDNPEDPRDDREGRRFGLQVRRPLAGIQPTKSAGCWPWARSTTS